MLMFDLMFRVDHHLIKFNDRKLTKSKNHVLRAWVKSYMFPTPFLIVLVIGLWWLDLMSYPKHPCPKPLFLLVWTSVSRTSFPSTLVKGNGINLASLALEISALNVFLVTCNFCYIVLIHDPRIEDNDTFSS